MTSRGSKGSIGTRGTAARAPTSTGSRGQVFFDERLLVLADDRHSMEEMRYHALGRTDDGRQLHVTFTLRGEGRLIRVISSRDMSRRERSRYAQQA
jgi:uncharacterized DUF497 family protein